MWLRTLVFIAAMAIVGGAIAQTTYFPKGSLAPPVTDELVMKWYSEQLSGMHEPSLLAMAKGREIEYRFTWLRTFHHPVAIRIVIKQDGTGQLIQKMASGTGGYRPGVLTQDVTRPLSPDEIKSFLALIDQTKFWSLPGYDEKGGNDGSEWIIEGVNAGKYHVVNRWTPDKGPVYGIGMAMIEQYAHLKISKDEMY